MDERKFRLVFTGILLLQLTGTALLALQQHRQQEQLQQQLDFFAATLAKPPTVSASIATAATQPPLPQQLRELIRAELKQRPVENTDTAKLAMTAAAKREQELQFANSDAVLSSALSSGRWTQRDTEALIPHLSQLSTAQRVQLLERFHAAVNRQELELEDIPPL